MLRSTAGGTTLVHHPLEGRPRHDAVLHGEEAEEQRIDDQRLQERRGGARVDRFQHDDVTDESNGIEERPEEHRIGGATVKDGCVAGHGHSSPEWEPLTTMRVLPAFCAMSAKWFRGCLAPLLAARSPDGEIKGGVRGAEAN